MTELQSRRASDEIPKAAEFYEGTGPDWYDVPSRPFPKSPAFDHATLERVATCRDQAGDTDTARLLRALQTVLVETTHEVFRDDTPAERENRLAPET
jgi:hypothetical protein